MSDTTLLRLGSSVVQFPDGKYGAVIHFTETGQVLTETGPRFNTLDAAKEAGSKILSEGIKKMKKNGLNAFRPH